jgi:hypothetical protein
MGQALGWTGLPAEAGAGITNGEPRRRELDAFGTQNGHYEAAVHLSAPKQTNCIAMAKESGSGHPRSIFLTQASHRHLDREPTLAYRLLIQIVVPPLSCKNGFRKIRGGGCECHNASGGQNENALHSRTGTCGSSFERHRSAGNAYSKPDVRRISRLGHR